MEKVINTEEKSMSVRNGNIDAGVALVMHLFRGLTAWKMGELEGQLKEGAWLHLRAPSSLVFSGIGKPNTWSSLLEQLGSEYAHIAKLPEDLDTI